MSYILDALRKADAQRERDPARGIHAQSVPVSPLARPVSPQNRLWLGGGLLLGAGLLAMAAWQLAAPTAPAVVVAVAAPVAPAAESRPLAVPPPANEVLPAPPSPLPPAVRTPATPSLREARKPAPAPAPALVATAPTTAPVAATPAAERVLSVNELPAEVQRELPKLAISGGVYSDNPAQRMLIVNGQVLGEGAGLAPGVLLEQIRAKTAVLKYRGYRYAVAY